MDEVKCTQWYNGTNQTRNKIDKEFLQTNATQELMWLDCLLF